MCLANKLVHTCFTSWTSEQSMYIGLFDFYTHTQVTEHLFSWFRDSGRAVMLLAKDSFSLGILQTSFIGIVAILYTRQILSHDIINTIFQNTYALIIVEMFHMQSNRCVFCH